GPAKVRRANRMISNQPDGRGTNEEAVVIVVGLAVVAAVVKAELGGIPLRQEILDIEVRDGHLLPAAMQFVEAAVGVLLEKVEKRAVVFEATRRQRAEHADARLLDHRDEAAKVSAELLDARAHRYERVA